MSKEAHDDSVSRCIWIICFDIDRPFLMMRKCFSFYPLHIIYKYIFFSPMNKQEICCELIMRFHSMSSSLMWISVFPSLCWMIENMKIQFWRNGKTILIQNGCEMLLRISWVNQTVNSEKWGFCAYCENLKLKLYEIRVEWEVDEK